MFPQGFAEGSALARIINEAGETIEDLESADNEAKLERKVRDWLRTKIREIEEERATQAIAGCP